MCNYFNVSNTISQAETTEVDVMVTMRRYELNLGLKKMGNTELAAILHEKMERSGDSNNTQRSVSHMRRYVETGIWEVLQEFNRSSRFRATLTVAVFNKAVSVCEYYLFILYIHA